MVDASWSWFSRDVPSTPTDLIDAIVDDFSRTSSSLSSSCTGGGIVVDDRCNPPLPPPPPAPSNKDQKALLYPSTSSKPYLWYASAVVAQDLVCARYLVELPLTTMVRGGGRMGQGCVRRLRALPSTRPRRRCGSTTPGGMASLGGGTERATRTQRAICPDGTPCSSSCGTSKFRPTWHYARP